MDKKLLKTRDEIYKRCPSVFWEVSIFTVIFGIALAALSALLPGLDLIIFGFIFFPLLFSTFMTLFSIKYGGTVTIKSTFNISRSYFSGSNFGCFKAIKCLLQAIVAYVFFLLIFIFLLEGIFADIYGPQFTDGIEQMNNLIYNNSDSLIDFLESENPVSLYYSFVLSLSFSGSLIVFIYGICYNSLNVYLCANIPNASASYCTGIFNRFLRFYGGSYRKDFWSLNWPLFVLLTLGIVGGYALTILLDINFDYAQVISTLLGLLCLVPFAPFFFANMEALFAKYNENIKRTTEDMTKGFLMSLRNNINISEEDKAKIDELLSKGMKPNNDDEKKDDDK